MSPQVPHALPPMPAVQTNGRHPTRSRRLRVVIWILIGVAVIGACLGVGSYVLIRSAVRGIGQGIGQGITRAIEDSAAVSASEAAHDAAVHRQPLASLSPQLLNAWNVGDVNWVSADTVVPQPRTGGAVGYSVSVSAEGAHVLAATYLGACSFGLTVSSSTDPIVTAFHLPGPGTYRAFNAGDPCDAASAPTTGWIPVSIPAFADTAAVEGAWPGPSAGVAASSTLPIGLPTFGERSGPSEL